MLHSSRFSHDGDVEGAACADGATDAAHNYHGDVFKGDVGGWFGHEHEGFVEAEEVAFVCFDAALNAGLLVVRDEFFGRGDYLFAREASEDLRDNVVLGRFVARLQFAFVFVFEEVSTTGGLA